MKLYILSVFLFIFSATLQGSGENYYFSLAGRFFTYAEALKLANGRSDIKSAVEENFAAAATIVLCTAENIELSAVRTREFLEHSLLLMPATARQDFQSMLVRENLTRQSWLDREQEKLNNQLSEAVMRWYIRRYGETSPITDEHVQNWYYRNMDIFRRIKLELSKVWVFKLADRTKVNQALAALQQAMPPETVRKNFAENLSENAILEELHSGNIQRTRLDDDYWLLTGGKHLFLTGRTAITYTALPLDETLKNAIRNALQEAVAKARLAETLKREFKAKKIVFHQ